MGSNGGRVCSTWERRRSEVDPELTSAGRRMALKLGSGSLPSNGDVWRCISTPTTQAQQTAQEIRLALQCDVPISARDLPELDETGCTPRCIDRQ